MIISVAYILNYFHTHSTNIFAVQMNTVTDESAAEENEDRRVTCDKIAEAGRRPSHSRR